MAEQDTRSRLLWRSVLSVAGMFLSLALIMFAPAGIGWRRGWLFFLVFWISMILSAAYLWRANPEIFLARSRIGRGTKAWDRVLLVPILVSFFAVFPTAGFDARYGPPWLVGMGYVLFVAGFAASTWVYAVNKFAEPSVRIQSERGQTVVDTGPYAIVRHPLYAASFLLMAGMPLALGSCWAFVPAATGAISLIVRIVLEDRTLQNELEGYRAYASRVRYRLIPGVW